MSKEQINMLVNLAASDNMIAEQEARHIRIIASAAGMSGDDVDEMLKDCLSSYEPYFKNIKTNIK